jgi:hypothetical protein
MTVKTSPTLVIAAMATLFFSLNMVLWAPNTVYSYLYDTYYSPQKKLSVDYPNDYPEYLKINETKTEVQITTPYFYISIEEEPVTYPDVKEESVSWQKGIQGFGHEIVETTHPFFIDGELGYGFKYKGENTKHDFYTIFVDHGVKRYFISIIHNPQFGILDHLDHVLNSIKFFN